MRRQIVDNEDDDYYQQQQQKQQEKKVMDDNNFQNKQIDQKIKYNIQEDAPVEKQAPKQQIMQDTSDIKEMQQVQKQMFDDFDYLYEQKTNLIDKKEFKQKDLQRFMQLVEPEETAFSQEVIEKSNQIIEQVSKKYEKDDIFVMKILKQALKQEEVQLIVKEEVTINEDRSLAQLLSGSYGQKQIVEMKFQDTKEYSFQQIKNSSKEKDNFISNLKNKLVASYNTTHPGENINLKDIVIIKIEQGSIKVHFIIKDKKGNAKVLTDDEMEDVAKKAGLTGFELKVHPFLKQCTLSPQQFDTRGNIDFTKIKAQVQQRGGLVYNQPDQWKRYGLKVMEQFKNEKGQIDDTWLTDWGVDGWAVAYHGFSEARGSNRTEQQKMMNYGINNIIQNGFMRGSNQAYKGSIDIKTGKPITEGIYFSNFVGDAEGYGSFIQIPEDPDNKYKIVFTCRLNPKGIQFATKTYYVVQDNKDIRPFGILLKKYPNK